MTDHNSLEMRKSDRRVTDKEIIKAMLDMCKTCTLSVHDEPYPYQVPLNFGYEWEDELIIYLHMASCGHKIELIKKDPRVSVNAHAYLDRSNLPKYRGGNQDYRSVTVFGAAQIITSDEPDEFMRGLNALQRHNSRKEISKAPKTDSLYVIKIKAEAFSAKAMYPINDISEAAMPPNQ